MTTPDAQQQLAQLQAQYGALAAQPLLRTMIQETFKGRIALISSFGADAALLLALVADVNPATPVFFLQTQKHFPQTLEYVETLKNHLGLTNVISLTPDPALVSRIDPQENLWQIQPDRCCWLRKIEPMQRAVHEYGIAALITGRKRYQTPERAQMSTIELDDEGIFRINPVADWSREQSAAEFEKRNFPAHPLLSQGYRSIGCAPCTIPVAPGQDERAGRWAHTAKHNTPQKTECGIHVGLESFVIRHGSGEEA